MPKTQSVAPKERINIRFKPDISAQEEIELPLKLLMMGDYLGQPDSTPINERKLISIDKNNFNEVLKAHQIKLNLLCDNRLSNTDEQISIELNIQSIRDFDPDCIAKQVPELKKLLAIREALVALKGPLGNTPQFRKKLSELIQCPNTSKKLLKETHS